MKGDIGKRKVKVIAEFQSNTSPETFYWTGKFQSWENAIKRIKKMQKTWHLVHYNIYPLKEENA